MGKWWASSRGLGSASPSHPRDGAPTSLCVQPPMPPTGVLTSWLSCSNVRLLQPGVHL